jgi:hypothetical protein
MHSNKASTRKSAKRGGSDRHILKDESDRRLHKDGSERPVQKGGSERHLLRGSSGRHVLNDANAIDKSKRKSRSRPGVQRRRSSSLSAMPSRGGGKEKQKEIHGKNGPVNGEVRGRVKARSTLERERSRSQTNLISGAKKKKNNSKLSSSSEHTRSTRPQMKETYDWQLHSQFTRSTQTNSSKAQRQRENLSVESDRQDVFAKTKYPSLSSQERKPQGQSTPEVAPTSPYNWKKSAYDWQSHPEALGSKHKRSSASAEDGEHSGVLKKADSTERSSSNATKAPNGRKKCAVGETARGTSRASKSNFADLPDLQDYPEHHKSSEGGERAKDPVVASENSNTTTASTSSTA